MKTIIKNVKIILLNSIVDGAVSVCDGKISGIHKNFNNTQSLNAEYDKVIDGGGKYLSPGFFDIHTHGAGGCDFMDGKADDFTVAAKTHMMHGTTSMLPTTVAASQQELLSCIDNFKIAKDSMKDGPNLIGLHMEGPYLNVEYKGAIDEKYIRIPKKSEYQELISRAEGGIARWTVAPELDGALQMGNYLVANGILPSIGHSSAEYSQVLTAYQHGFTHVTHLYSAMSTIVRRGGFRFSGVLESAFVINGMTVELIADGCHLPSELLEMTHRFKGVSKTCLVCDSIRCAGTNIKESFIGSLTNGQPIIVEDDVAKLPDRSAFAGSVATDDRIVRVMHKSAGVSLCDCVAMMCHTPAKILRLEDNKGSIEVGKDADLILFDNDINVSLVMINGKITIGA